MTSSIIVSPTTNHNLSTRIWQRRLFLGALLCVDAAMLVLSFTLAYWLRFRLGVTVAPEVTPSVHFYIQLVALLIPIWLGLFFLLRLYDFRILLGGTEEYARVFNGVSSGMMLVVVASFIAEDFVISRVWLVISWMLTAVTVNLARFCLRRLAYRLRRRGYFVSPAIIVGYNSEALTLARQLSHSESSGLHILGLVSDTSEEGESPIAPGDLAPSIVGGLRDLRRIVQQLGVEEVIVATTALNRRQLMAVFEDISPLPGVNLCLSSGLYEIFTTNVYVRRLGYVPLVTPYQLRLDSPELAMKTALDYVLTVSGLIVLWPLLVLLALLIKLDSPGPILHRRQVMGAGGKVFYAFKFRSMVTNGDEILARHPELRAEIQANHKLKDDPRVTRMGRWLRRYSLDELPQLFNVLLGQMSLVGPRMITPAEVDMYGEHRFNLLTVKPGITGLWQVSGRSDVSYEERVRLDMHYIRNYTIWLDWQILFVQTLPAVLKGHGAY